MRCAVFYSAVFKLGEGPQTEKYNNSAEDEDFDQCQTKQFVELICFAAVILQN